MLKQCTRAILVFLPLSMGEHANAQPSQPLLDCLVAARSTVEIGANRTGVVHEIEKDRGDRVSAGEVVARFDTQVEEAAVKLSELQVENTMAEAAAQARVDMLSRRLDRIERLTKRKVVAEAERDEVATELEVARQDLESARFNRSIAQLELERARVLLEQGTIRSPVTGVVVNRNLEPGEYRNDQMHILTIAALDPLFIEVFAPLSELGKITIGMTATVSLEAPLSYSRPATVTVVDPVIDAASGTFGIRMEMKNPDFVIPAGLRCTAFFDG